MTGPVAAGGGVVQEPSIPHHSKPRVAKRRFMAASWRVASGRATCIVPGMSDDQRLTRIEERYAHLQRHSAEQDKVMLQLTDELAKLRKEIASLRTQQAGGREGEEVPDERPPHY